MVPERFKGVGVSPEVRCKEREVPLVRADVEERIAWLDRPSQEGGRLRFDLPVEEELTVLPLLEVEVQHRPGGDPPSPDRRQSSEAMRRGRDES